MNLINGQCVRASDGRVFRYSVDVTPWFWSAHVRDEFDRLVGTPQLGVFGRRLSSEKLRSCAVNWIEEVIRDEGIGGWNGQTAATELPGARDL